MVIDSRQEISVSVIIITYNHKSYAQQAVDSVLSQKTGFGYEIIIADDCSTDGTIEIINGLAAQNKDKIKVLLHEKNVGTTKNLCDAFSLVKGKYIAICAGDDYWCDDLRIEKQAEWLDLHADYVGISNSYAILRDDHLQRNCIRKSLLNKDNTVELYLKEQMFFGASTMYRNIFQGSDREEKFMHIQSNRLIEDISLPMLLLEAGKFRILAGDVYVYRVRKNENNYNSVKSAVEAFKEHIDTIMENDKYFGGRYNFGRLISRKVAIAILRSLSKFHFSNIVQVYKYIPKKYISACWKYFLLDTLVLIRYKIVGYF